MASSSTWSRCKAPSAMAPTADSPAPTGQGAIWAKPARARKGGSMAPHRTPSARPRSATPRSPAPGAAT
eukprot:6891032-Lingulodinium_polyedra.AAC.1